MVTTTCGSPTGSAGGRSHCPQVGIGTAPVNRQWLVPLRDAKCLYAMTPEGHRRADEKPAEDEHGLAAEDVARMRREMENARRDYKVIESTHGDNVLNLLVAVAYVKKLLSNTRVARFLHQHHTEVGEEFKRLLDAPDLDAAPAR